MVIVEGGLAIGRQGSEKKALTTKTKESVQIHCVGNKTWPFTIIQLDAPNILIDIEINCFLNWNIIVTGSESLPSNLVMYLAYFLSFINHIPVCT